MPIAQGGQDVLRSDAFASTTEAEAFPHSVRQPHPGKYHGSSEMPELFEDCRIHECRILKRCHVARIWNHHESRLR